MWCCQRSHKNMASSHDWKSVQLILPRACWWHGRSRRNFSGTEPQTVNIYSSLASFVTIAGYRNLNSWLRFWSPRCFVEVLPEDVNDNKNDTYATGKMTQTIALYSAVTIVLWFIISGPLYLLHCVSKNATLFTFTITFSNINQLK